MFLSDGTTAIVNDLAENSPPGSEGGAQRPSKRQDTDGHLYSAMAHIHVVYYMVYPGDKVDGPDSNSFISAVRVDLRRMLRLVEIGLLHAEVQFDWGNTYEVRSAEVGRTDLALPASLAAYNLHDDRGMSKVFSSGLDRASSELYASTEPSEFKCG